MSKRDYNYRVKWSPADDAFIARVLEFESLTAHGDSKEEALLELQEVVATVVKDLEANGEPIPKPKRKLIKKHIVR